MFAAASEPTVSPGNYTSEINVHNFQRSAVRLTKRAVIANPQGQPRGPVSTKLTEALEADQALEINCSNIAAMFPDTGEPPPNLLKGFVVIESVRELDVAAVHTALKMDLVDHSVESVLSGVGIGVGIGVGAGVGLSIDVEHIPAKVLLVNLRALPPALADEATRPAGD